jgi:AraC-like DNA-binding protein
VRFTRAAEQLRGGGAPAEVAATCGYADQAHLTRAVRRFGATTPAALRRSRPAPVTSVQDGAAAPA